MLGAGTRQTRGDPATSWSKGEYALPALVSSGRRRKQGSTAVATSMDPSAILKERSEMRWMLFHCAACHPLT